MSHSFLPMFYSFKLKLSGQRGAPPPKSDQLHHFALSGQLCRETKPQTHFSMVTKFILETHTKDCCDQPTASYHVAKPKGLGPRVSETHFLQPSLLFESGVHGCTAALKWEKSNKDSHTELHSD